MLIRKNKVNRIDKETTPWLATGSNSQMSNGSGTSALKQQLLKIDKTITWATSRKPNNLFKAAGKIQPPLVSHWLSNYPPMILYFH